MEAFLQEKGIELEVRMLSDRNEIPKILAKLMDAEQAEISASVSLINGERRMEIFFDGDKVSRQETIAKQRLFGKKVTIADKKFNLSVAREEKIDEKFLPQVVRIKYRLRFKVKTEKLWYCDITLVKDSPADFPTIRANRIKFFERMAKSDIPVASKDEVWELELECADPSQFEMGDLDKIVSEVFGNETTILSPLCSALGVPCTHTATLKKLLPNAIELSRNVFITEIWPEIQEAAFAITDKADGERMIIHAAQEVFLIAADKKIQLAAAWTHGESIFECEYVDGKAYIYDIIMLDGKNLTKLPFKERWQPDFKLGLKDVYFKKFYFLDSKNYVKQLKASFAAELPYETDGLIFSSINEPYRRMRHYKWKPIEKSSIDFLCKKAPVLKPGKDIKKLELERRAGLISKEEPNNKYFLFCSISPHDFKMLGLRHVQGYETLFERKKEPVFPVHFCPSSQPLAYQFEWDGENLDDQIVEFGYQPSTNFAGHAVPSLKFMRIRHDRQDDYKKGYYGNYFRIAEFVWNSFNDPLTKEIIMDPQKAVADMYFQKPSDEWIRVRKHNNNVKRMVIQKYASGSKWALDLACGKGQDLLKYSSAGVRNIIMVDSVPDNISQVIQRKYSNLKVIKNPMSVYTFCIDLKGGASEICQEISSNGIPFETINFISCNLAIHYLLGDPEQFENTVRMFANFATSGTKIMITSLDGSKVFNLLKSGNFTSKSGKFAIKKMWTGGRLLTCGQKISIKLPFAETAMEENLVNYKALEQEFKKYKIKLTDFGTFGEDFLDGLTEEEKNYISLHSWAVFVKS